MNRWHNRVSPLLLGMLLMAVLVGVAGDARDLSAAAGSRQLIVPAAYFYPSRGNWEYNNEGYRLYSTDLSTIKFLAPVQFPVPYYATVEKLELMAYDNTSSDGIRVWLCKTKPAAGDRIEMGYIDTGGSFASPTDPRIWVDSSINDSTVRPAEKAYLELELELSASLLAYGVRVWYHPGF